MTRFKKINIITAITVATCINLCGCGNAVAETVEEAPAKAEVVEEQEQSVSILATEDDYRKAIAELDSSDVAGKIALYEEFSNVYQLSEEEYLDYANACESNGDTRMQREVLWKLYRLDPSKEHGEMLSQVAYTLSDSEDADAVKMIQSFADVLDAAGADDFAPSALLDFVSTDDWNNAFCIANGTFASHTVYEGNKVASDIVSDKLLTKGKIIRDGKMFVFEIAATGCNIANCVVSGSEPDGEFASFEYEADGKLALVKRGTIKGGYCVDDITVVLNGTEYKGSFGEDGITTAEQVEGLAGAVYAYDNNGSNYLYADGEDASSWKADLKFAGLEKAE